MSNTIQQAPNISDLRYGRKSGLNADSQNGLPLRDGNLSVKTAGREEAYTVDISEQARKLYSSSTEIKQNMTEATTAMSYENSLSDTATVYNKSFSEISEKFADLQGKISSGNYERSDVTVNDLKLDIIDEMEQKYQEYKSQLISSSSGEESQKQLEELDKAYNSSFEKNILDPLKGIYGEKISYYEPNQLEDLKNTKIWAENPEIIQNSIQHALNVQVIEQNNYDALTKGLQDFYSVAKDQTSWHNSEKIKSVLTDSMNVYSEHKQDKFDVGDNSLFKRYADKISKEVSDKYTETMNYKLNKMGLSAPGAAEKERTQSDDNKLSIYDFISVTSSGIYYIDLSSIDNVDELLNQEVKMISGYRYGHEDSDVSQ